MEFIGNIGRDIGEIIKGKYNERSKSSIKSFYGYNKIHVICPYQVIQPYIIKRETSMIFLLVIGFKNIILKIIMRFFYEYTRYLYNYLIRKIVQIFLKLLENR